MVGMQKKPVVYPIIKVRKKLDTDEWLLFKSRSSDRAELNVTLHGIETRRKWTPLYPFRKLIVLCVAKLRVGLWRRINKHNGNVKMLVRKGGLQAPKSVDTPDRPRAMTSPHTPAYSLQKTIPSSWAIRWLRNDNGQPFWRIPLVNIVKARDRKWARCAAAACGWSSARQL